MRKILLFTIFIVFSALTFGQSINNNYLINLKFPNNHSIYDQKNNIDFFRDFFGTNECTFDSTTNTYTVISVHNYNPIELEQKIKKNSTHTSFTITIIKATEGNPINNSEL